MSEEDISAERIQVKSLPSEHDATSFSCEDSFASGKVDPDQMRFNLIINRELSSKGNFSLHGTKLVCTA